MRLLVVDDHEVVRRGVRSLLLENFDCEFCGEAVDGQDALEKARQLRPDLIVMDVSMPRLNGLDSTRQIRTILPQCEVVILSQHESVEMARQALKAGARGYVVKSSISKDLITAVHKVSKGECFFNPAVLEQSASAHLDVQEILQRSAAFEQALRQSEQLYRSTFELAGVGVAHVSPEGKWLRVNKKLCEIVGYTEPELLGITFQDITHPDDLAADLAQTEKVRNGTLHAYTLEKRYIRKDRSVVWINLTVSGVRDSDGRLEHFISVIEDINSRKSAERALRESEERLQVAQQAANVGTFEWNIKTGVNRWTPELERIYGLPPGGFAGTQSAWENLLHPEDRERAINAVKRVLSEKGTGFEEQWRVIWGDGSVHWLLGRAWVLRDDAGLPDRLIGVNVDITERKRVEDALAESRKQLVLALESSKTAMFDWDVLPGRGKWNAQMTALYGFEPEGEYITADEWVRLFHPDDVQRLTEEAAKFWAKGEEFSFEFRTAPRNGEFKWMTSRGRIVRDADGRAVRMIGIHADISDRKRAEQTLQDRQAELNEAQRLSRIGSWHWKPASDTVVWSDELYRIAGRDPQLPAVSYQDHHKLYTPESWDRLQSVVNETLKSGTPYSVELEMVRPDGEKRCVVANGEAQCDSNGGIIALRGTVQDITDRKRIEDELRESEERTRFSLEAANIGTWDWDVLTGRIRWSRNMESVHGQAPGSFTESFDSFLEGVFVADRDKVNEEIRLALAGRGTYHVEYRQYRSDGTLGWMEAHGRVVFDGDGKPLRMFGICANVTERRNAQDATGLLAAIVASSDDAIVSKTLDGIITSWNAGAEKVFGYKAQEAVGQHITLIIPPDRRAEEDDILVRLRRAEKIDHFQTVRRRKDGTLIDVSVTISPVRDSSGRVIGASKVARDITAQKEAAEKIRVADETLRLMKAQDEERRRIARDFHDSAGQTLTVLGLSLNQLVQNAELVAPEIAKEGRQIEEIVQQLHREIRTTSYLLHPPLLDEAGLNSALNWYVQGLMERSRMAIDFSIPDDFGRLPADMELAIFRVVQECLTNIHRHAQSKTARIRIARENGSVCIDVRDEGKGISPERIAEIQSRASGVGIAGIRERLSQFGGTMSIESNGSGTRILGMIPLPKGSRSPDQEPVQAVV